MRENLQVESDKPHSRKLYKRKGWKGFVQSWKKLTTNGNWEKVEWKESGKSKSKVIYKDDFVTVYKF
jgi:hypothetical protein